MDALHRIVSKRGKDLHDWSLCNTFVDPENGRFTATDTYSLIAFDAIEPEEFDEIRGDEKCNYITKNERTLPKCGKLFDPFLKEYKKWYGDDCCEALTLKEIEERYKESKNDGNVRRTFDCLYNMKWLRDICIALDGRSDYDNTVSINYPKGTNNLKPIVIFGECGYGLLMPRKQI